MIGRHSPEWGIIKGWLITKIADGHANMERGVSLEDYHLARGQISLCRALIEAVEPSTPPKIDEDDYGISTPVD